MEHEIVLVLQEVPGLYPLRNEKSEAKVLLSRPQCVAKTAHGQDMLYAPTGSTLLSYRAECPLTKTMPVFCLTLAKSNGNRCNANKCHCIAWLRASAWREKGRPVWHKLGYVFEISFGCKCVGHVMRVSSLYIPWHKSVWSTCMLGELLNAFCCLLHCLCLKNRNSTLFELGSDEGSVG